MQIREGGSWERGSCDRGTAAIGGGIGVRQGGASVRLRSTMAEEVEHVGEQGLAVPLALYGALARIAPCYENRKLLLFTVVQMAMVSCTELVQTP